MVVIDVEPTVKEGKYLAWDDMGVELETAQFLYGLVRMLKPKRVFETGTGQGYASVYIATALYENGSGMLTTFEPVEQYAKIARQRLNRLPAQVESRNFRWFDGEKNPDLVFLDSGPQYRQDEINFWLPQQTNLVIHDAFRYEELNGSGGIMLPGRGLWVRLGSQ